MKKVLLLLLAFTISTTLQSQKLSRKKIQITGLKDATFLGTDNKGNVIESSGIDMTKYVPYTTPDPRSSPQVVLGKNGISSIYNTSSTLRNTNMNRSGFKTTTEKPNVLKRETVVYPGYIYGSKKENGRSRAVEEFSVNSSYFNLSKRLGNHQHLDKSITLNHNSLTIEDSENIALRKFKLSFNLDEPYPGDETEIEVSLPMESGKLALTKDIPKYQGSDNIRIEIDSNNPSEPIIVMKPQYNIPPAHRHFRGSMYYDRTIEKMKMWNGTEWKILKFE